MRLWREGGLPGGTLPLLPVTSMLDWRGWGERVAGLVPERLISVPLSFLSLFLRTVNLFLKTSSVFTCPSLQVEISRTPWGWEVLLPKSLCPPHVPGHQSRAMLGGGWVGSQGRGSHYSVIEALGSSLPRGRPRALVE